MKKKLYIINGPNLNLLGRREPEKYGRASLETVKSICLEKCKDYSLDLHFFQSNVEGELISEIHKAIDDGCGVIINAGGLSHTSVSILDALLAIKIPKIEVHISNLFTREEFRHSSYISKGVSGVVCGFGLNGYLLAIDGIKKLI